MSQFREMRSKKCETAISESNPGNANLPIGDGATAQNANREIGVPGVRQPTPALKFKLVHYRMPGSAQFPALCWYNSGMTLMEITYELQSPLQPEQLRALGSFANTYGLRRFRVDEKTNRLSFEYDASRLKETEVEHVLRQARIPVTRRVEPVGTVSQT